jgi:chromate transporter
MSEPGGQGLAASTGTVAAPVEAARRSATGLGAIFRVFLTMGVTSFGGGVVAYLRQNLVVRQRWLDEDDFLSGLEISQTLPGLNATNMSVYAGERLRGARGAIVASLGMILPGAIIVLVLGILYARHGNLPDVRAVLEGVGAAAVGLTLATTIQVGRKQLGDHRDLVLIVVTCVAVGVFRVSLPLAISTLGPLGIWLYRPRAGGSRGDAGATT